jgi:hypothetical protein
MNLIVPFGLPTWIPRRHSSSRSAYLRSGCIGPKGRKTFSSNEKARYYSLPRISSQVF